MATIRRSRPGPPFESIYRHGYARVAVATPRVEVASPVYNAAQTLALARRASSSVAARFAAGDATSTRGVAAATRA